MQLNRFISVVALALTFFVGFGAKAQTTAGSGTVMVLPLAANVQVYKTEVFVRNPNTVSITLDVLYSQANNAAAPTGLRQCLPQLTVPAGQVRSFLLNTQCTLGNVDDFGMIILEDTSVPKTHPFFAYSRTQTTGGNGFSVEGFPAGNFSGAPANVIGLKRQATAPKYRSNCFIGSLGEPVFWQMRLWQEGGVSTPIDGTSGPVQGSLQPYEIVRIIDVFAGNDFGTPPPYGVSAPVGDYFNVRANFTNTGNTDPNAPPAQRWTNSAFIAFCTLEESTFGGADFRIAKSDDAWDTRQSRLACYGQDDCGLPSVNGAAQVTDVTKKNIHYLILNQPDYVQCNLVSTRLADLELLLRPPGDPAASTPFPASAPYYNGGPSHETEFYIFTGDRFAIGAGHTTRWYIDVQFRPSSVDHTSASYGITCRSGNGVTVPWLGTTGPANP